MTSLTPGSGNPLSKDAFWKEIYEQYFAVFHYYAHKYTDHKEEARDLVSDAFERVIRMNLSFPGKIDAYKYLYVVIRNACHTYVRKKGMQASKSTAIAILFPLWEERSAVLFQEAMDLKEILDKLLQSVNPQEQAILKLFYYDDKSIPEIAAALGTTENSVRVQKSNALKKIRKANPDWPDNLIVFMLLILREIGVVVN